MSRRRSRLEQGLVEVMIVTSGKSRKRYIVTEKGVNVLSYFERANEIRPPDEYADLYSAHAISG